jgi:hypothetical protein
MSHVEIERRVSKAAYSGKERRLPPKPAVAAKPPAGIASQVVYSGPERRKVAGVGPNGVERRKVL